MDGMLKPLKAESLKEVFISRFEDLILTGKLAIGQKLPPERELAVQLGVSRPVVHEGLLDLAVKGLVTMKPRVGTVVNDYRKEGSLVMLESIFNFRRDNLDSELMRSLLEVRLLMEVETARLASKHRSKEHMRAFRDILAREGQAVQTDFDGLAGLDFELHQLIALASGNLVYPLLINSFKPVYTTMTSLFFSTPEVVPKVHSSHEKLVDAIENKDGAKASQIMSEMLVHGEQHLIRRV